MIALFKVVPKRFSQFRKELKKTISAIKKKWKIAGLTEQEVYDRQLELTASEIRRSDIVINNLLAAIATILFTLAAWHFVIVKHLSQ